MGVKICSAFNNKNVSHKNVFSEKQIGSSTTEFTLVDYPTMDDRLRNKELKSSDRLKQEVNNEQTNLFKF